MISIQRRQLMAGIGAAVASVSFGPVARAAMGPDDKFDLVIKGGEVVDPSQGLRGKRDIGMRYGRIEALEAEQVSLATLLADANAYTRDPKGVATAQARVASIDDELLVAMERWEVLGQRG